MLTKQRTSQSLRLNGARKAYDLLLSFLETRTIDLQITNVSIEYFVWAESQDSTKLALAIESQLIKDFGGFDSNYDARLATEAKTHIPNHYEQSGSIQPSMPTSEIMDYLDRLGPLRELRPRPPLNAVVSATFFMPGAEGSDPKTGQHMRSSMIAWLSPSSNAVSYSLHFPQQEYSDAFEHAKHVFEADCGVKLEDKYFHLRTQKPNGSFTFKKLYR
jgi:hypothetical protein